MLISKCVIHTLLERIPNNHELLASMKLHLTLFVDYADAYEKVWNSIWWNDANTATKKRVNEKLNRLAFDAATSLFDAIALFDDYCDLMDKNSIPSTGWAELTYLSFKDAVDTLGKEHSREINSIQLPLFKQEKIMLELFEQYKHIHHQITESSLSQIILQITGDRYCLISSDFFAFGGEFEQVEEALKVAIANNQLLENQEG